MFYLLDADMNGADSIAPLIASGAVTHLPCGTYPDFRDHTTRLLSKVGQDDVVILDTVTLMADTTRGDIKVGPAPEADLWEMRGKLLLDELNRNSYDAAGKMIMRPLRNLRARGARIITVCHEGEQEDKTTLTKKIGPAVNPALFSSLVGSASDMFRLTMLSEPIIDGEGNVKIPAYARVLEMRPNEDALTKFHVARDLSEKIPKKLVEPTLTKLYKVLGKKPSWLLLYGSPGVGKTTLATNEQGKN